MRVELDKKSIMALASDTRLEILRSLQPMRRTVSQLSEALGMDKAGVHRHLKKMEEGGLVKRYEEHGFVYYGLTWKARDLLVPNENTRIVILLSAVWILCLGVVLFVAAALLADGGNDTLSGLFPMDAYDHSDEGVRPTSDDGVSFASWAIPSLSFGAAAAILLLLALRVIQKPLQASPETAISVEVLNDVED